MNSPDEPGGPPTSEDRLTQLLAELKDAPAPPGPRTEQILRTVRWERALRQAALTVAGLGTAVVGTLGVLLGHRDRGQRR